MWWRQTKNIYKNANARFLLPVQNLQLDNYYRLISYFLSNISDAKKYRNRTVCVNLIASQRQDVFETQCSSA